MLASCPLVIEVSRADEKPAHHYSKRRLLAEGGFQQCNMLESAKISHYINNISDNPPAGSYPGSTFGTAMAVHFGG